MVTAAGGGLGELNAVPQRQVTTLTGLKNSGSEITFTVFEMSILFHIIIIISGVSVF